MRKAMLAPTRGLAGAKLEEPREAKVPHPSYQPTAKELSEDLRLKGTFEDAIKALVRPVRVRKVMRARSKPSGE